MHTERLTKIELASFRRVALFILSVQILRNELHMEFQEMLPKTAKQCVLFVFHGIVGVLVCGLLQRNRCSGDLFLARIVAQFAPSSRAQLSCKITGLMKPYDSNWRRIPLVSTFPWAHEADLHERNAQLCLLLATVRMNMLIFLELRQSVLCLVHHHALLRRTSGTSAASLQSLSDIHEFARPRDFLQSNNSFFLFYGAPCVSSAAILHSKRMSCAPPIRDATPWNILCKLEVFQCKNRPSNVRATTCTDDFCVLSFESLQHIIQSACNNHRMTSWWTSFWDNGRVVVMSELETPMAPWYFCSLLLVRLSSTFLSSSSSSEQQLLLSHRFSWSLSARLLSSSRNVRACSCSSCSKDPLCTSSSCSWASDTSFCVACPSVSCPRHIHQV